ncbi:MAG: hypothetical protein WC522_06985 [Candidatus Omnitrophota bacterium]
MCTFKNIKYYILIMLISSSALLVCVPFAYADDNNRYHSNSSSVFAPGYLNAAKYQAEAIIRQQTPKRSFLDDVAEFVLGKTSNKVDQAAQEKAANAPKLQQKQSSSNKTASARAASIIGHSPSHVARGTGTDQRDANGALVSDSGKAMMSEIINGVRYHYAGFTGDTVDTIQAAVDRAMAGDVVIARSGAASNSAGGYKNFVITKAISVYGGYDDNGDRSGRSNVVGTIVVDGVNDASHTVEIGGFNVIQPPGGMLIFEKFLSELKTWGGGYVAGIAVRNSNSVTIDNCSTSLIQQGLYVSNSTVSISRTQLNGLFYGIRAINSSVTADSNEIKGLSGGVGTAGPGFIVIPGGAKGKGISGDDSTFLLNNNIISGAGQNILLDDNSSASYAKARSTQTVNILNIDNKPFMMDDWLYATDFNKNLSGIGPYLADEYKTGKLGDIFKGLLGNKDALFDGGSMPVDPALLARIMSNAQNRDALAIQLNGIDLMDMNIASILANIIKNPSEDQRAILNAIELIMKEADKLSEDAKSAEIKKASDELLQAVALALLTQAMPDLLKRGDIANIKSIFSELESVNKKVLLEYNTAAKPYYDNVIKDLSKNMALLQLKNILSGEMSREQLERLPPSELDKILEKIKMQKDKAFEEEYILQQEAKYRNAYLEPSRKKLEADMKNMLKDFTGKINNALKTTEK